jgi:A/G-specific adenine glycosylase
MWRLPVRERALVAGLPLLHRRKYGITKYRVTLHVHDCPASHAAASGGNGEEWIELDALAGLVIPPADRAALSAVLADREEIA